MKEALLLDSPDTAHDPSPAPPAQPQAWKERTGQYHRLWAFTFSGQKDIDVAIEIFFRVAELIGAPFRSVGYNTLYVPTEAVSLLEFNLARRDIHFTKTKVLKAHELPSVIAREKAKANQK